MPMTPGLGAALRLDQFAPQEEPAEAPGVDVEIPDDPAQLAGPDSIVINDDGSVSVSLDGKPVYLGEPDGGPSSREWFRNLVDEIDAAQLSMISEDQIGRAHV